MKTPLRLSAAAFALLAALPAAGTEPAWFDAAVKGWEEKIEPVDAFTSVVFNDEAGAKRTLFYRTDAVAKNALLPIDAPLYVLSVAPSRHESHKFQGVDADVVFFETNEVSPYYLKRLTSNEAVIGRRDRAETSLRSDLGTALNWWTQSPAFPDCKPDASCDKKALAVFAKAPKKSGSAAATPLPIAPNDAVCAGLEGSFKLPTLLGSDGHATIKRGLLPFEMELLESGTSRIAFDAFMGARYDSAVARIDKDGKFDEADAVVAAARVSARMISQAWTKIYQDGPAQKDRFYADEAKLILCRLSHPNNGKWPFAAAAEKAGADPKTNATFVANWRAFLAEEHARYLKESATVKSALPDVPDHDAYNKAMQARAADALAGKFPAPPAAVIAAKPAPPKISAPQAKAKIQTIEKMIDPDEAFK